MNPNPHHAGHCSVRYTTTDECDKRRTETARWDDYRPVPSPRCTRLLCACGHCFDLSDLDPS